MAEFINLPQLFEAAKLQVFVGFAMYAFYDSSKTRFIYWRYVILAEISQRPFYLKSQVKVEVCIFLGFINANL